VREPGTKKGAYGAEGRVLQKKIEDRFGYQQARKIVKNSQRRQRTGREHGESRLFVKGESFKEGKLSVVRI